MKQAGTIDSEAAFSFSTLRSVAVHQLKSFIYNKAKSAIYLQNTVNNFLKTPEEMDADFYLEMGVLASHLKDQYNKPDASRKFSDTNNTYIPGSTGSGFMEENY